MEIRLNGEIMLFEEVLLNINVHDIKNIFYKKNNKTLGQTFNHPKYSKLKTILGDKYGYYNDYNLGDFLKRLKEADNVDYKCFLNKYGDFEFCEFSINQFLEDKGIYCFALNNEIKYVGRCINNFKKRINHGYGKITAKKCFIDGQTTNCHINSNINMYKKKDRIVQLGIYKMTDKNEIKKMEKLILACHSFEWNLQRS